MKYDTKVRIAEICIILAILGGMAFLVTVAVINMSSESNTNKIQKKALDSSTSTEKANQENGIVESIKEPTDPSYLKHKKFLVENDCWVILVVRNYESSNFHYQCLKAPNFYTYRSIYYYPTRDYYNHIEGMTEVERLQKQIAVNKQIKPNYFESAY
jgi:hypothetical protein